MREQARCRPDAPGDPPVHHRDDRVRDQRADAAEVGLHPGGGPGPEGGRRGDHRQRTDGIHRGSAASSGRGGQGVEPGRAAEVLPDREAGDDLAWFRQLGAWKYDSSRCKIGRPRKRRDIRKLVVEMAQANPGWGYTKIRDALRTGLKIEIGRTTVASILAEAGIEPAPEREKKRTWKQFVKMHWETLYACDFFSVEALGISGMVRHMVFFVIKIKSRAIEIAGIQVDPGGEWMKQIARNLVDADDGFLRGATHLIHDRDPLFTEAFTAILRSGGGE